MTIMSADATGAPRLMRAVTPRAAAAGMTPGEAARDHVAALAPLWVKHGPTMTVRENGTQRLRSGATVVKLAQHVGGIPFHDGELRVMMYADGGLAAVSGTLRPAMPSKLSFGSSPREALSHALDQLYGPSRPQPVITELAQRERDGWIELSVATDTSLQVIQARARREIASVAGKHAAAWAVEIAGHALPVAGRDPSLIEAVAHSYLIADKDGRVVADADLIARDAFVYRAYAETTGNRRPTDGALESFAPHPTGVPDGSVPGFATANLVTIDSFNGPHDKWLPDNATTTAGNNAEAFSDPDGSNTFTAGDVRPNVTGGRILNFRYDPTAEPTASDTQLKAGAVNSFFIVNWMHDWWYDSGFTEATGNAQLDNYGRGGVDGDPITVAAQNGALIGSRENAFMFTPADGFSPLMQMFLWTTVTESAVLAPAGAIRSETFSAPPHVFDLTAQVVAGVDGTVPSNDGCQPITNDLTGKIVLLTFSGVCGSAATVNNAKAAGAIGVVLADGDLDDPRAFAGSAAANIPGLAIGKTDGQALAAAIAAGPVVITLHAAPLGPERDGDVDNTIVAHEWGHYLHHRLAPCATGTQCRGMSEGWGDFNALMMMLRDGDNRNGTYAVASYAFGDGTFDAAYFGLRRFPYSIDTTKNALRLRHIADENALPTETPSGRGGVGAPHTEVHNQGEVWASMLWEAFNVLIDAHDVPTARRRMSDYIVAGLLLTPPEASFTEGRDAILAAASALDSDDMLLIAAAFAGRGSGTCAVVPGNEVLDNAGVVESGTLAARLEVSNVTVNDDGISCDHDGYLDPGESGTLRVTVANTGALAAEDVNVVPTTSSPGLRFGKVNLGFVPPFTSLDLTIPVTLLPTAPRAAAISLSLHVTGDNQCVRSGVTVASSTLTGVDEVPNSARIDHLDTRSTPWTRTGGGAEALWTRAALVDPANPSWFGENAGFPSDTQLVTPVLTASATESLVLSFVHTFALEGAPGQLFDGGVIEASSDGGATWTDVSALGVDPGYSGTLVAGGANPINGRLAYSGVADQFPTLLPVVLDFGTRFAGQSVQFRFRLGADLNTAFLGWLIDDVQVTGTTNLPFPSLQTETATCAARGVSTVEAGVVATRTTPGVSLRPFDGDACIANDRP